ncbi:unnamed protein product [Effrenium voratum]|nr:unnamed protein product [Effrenium voratum]
MQLSKNMVSRSKTRKRHRLLQLLHRELKRLSRPSREAVIFQQMSQGQKMTFEHWILSTQRLPDATAVGVQADTGRTENSANPTGGRQRRKCGTRSFGQRSLQINRHAKCRPGAGLTSWLDKSGRRFYVATVVTEHLQIRAAAMRDIETAKKLLESLREGQAVATSAKACESWDLEETLGAALYKALSQRGLETLYQRMRFSVRVPARRWIGGALQTPYLADLRTACRARRKLLEARGPTRAGDRTDLADEQDLEARWKNLQSLYLEVCKEAGSDIAQAADHLEEAQCCRQASLKAAAAVKAQKLQARFLLRTEKRKAAEACKVWKDKLRGEAFKAKLLRSELRVQQKAWRMEQTEVFVKDRIARLLARWRVLDK